MQQVVKSWKAKEWEVMGLGALIEETKIEETTKD
jgi:hypothetical protein